MFGDLGRLSGAHEAHQNDAGHVCDCDDRVCPSDADGIHGRSDREWHHDANYCHGSHAGRGGRQQILRPGDVHGQCLHAWHTDRRGRPLGDRECKHMPQLHRVGQNQRCQHDCHRTANRGRYPHDVYLAEAVNQDAAPGREDCQCDAANPGGSPHPKRRVGNLKSEPSVDGIVGDHAYVAKHPRRPKQPELRVSEDQVHRNTVRGLRPTKTSGPPSWRPALCGLESGPTQPPANTSLTVSRV